MGAYYLTNNDDKTDQIVELMQKKQLTRFRTIRVGALTILNFQKINVPDYDNVYTEGEDFIIGFGTYYYRNLFGEAALSHIWQEYKAGNNVFSEVGGHFNFILHDKGVTKIIADKTGYYHAFSATENGRFYVSSSLFAIAESLTELKLNKQEILEFINVEAVFGGRTIFSNIDHLEAGCIYEVSPELKRKPYYVPEDEDIDFSTFTEKLCAYFDVLKHADIPVSCDLTGGYDTRVVASILMYNDIDVVYNTNVNDTDPNDHLVAQQIAETAGAQIETQTKDFSRYDYNSLVERCSVELETARDVYRSAYSSVFFNEKSISQKVVLGGYGGELYRDKYSRFKSLRELITKRYLLPGIKFNKGGRKTYINNLLQKFTETLARLDEGDTKKGMEKIYYFEKMRYWGGSRISAFNQYCFRVHPLIDYILMKYLFDVSLSEKKDGKFQERLIVFFAGDISEIQFSHEVPLSLTETRSPGDIIRYFSFVAKSVAKKIIPSLPSSVKSMIVKKSQKLSVYLRDYKSLADYGLEDVLQLRKEDLTNHMALSRYLTIAKTIGRFKEKIR